MSAGDGSPRHRQTVTNIIIIILAHGVDEKKHNVW